ncbi:WD40/YVTN/BNR-like repeat-containing protein [Glaciecola sp. 1036]|uniref:WD40/YVTN/BNR-like repeat-containing protein n=1 Tax=Alteromonadaceae TaxID=72275 RepID=UPI003D01F585
MTTNPIKKTMLRGFQRIFIGVFCAILPAYSCFAQDAKWQPIGPRAATVISMERSLVSPNIVYAGTYFGGLYKSVDGGISWAHLESSLSNKAVFAIETDPLNLTTLYAGTFEHGIYKSLDQGESWESINNGLTDLSIQDILLIPGLQRVLAATEEGVFYSDDGGNSWTKASAEQDRLYGKTLIQDATDSDTIYLGTSGFGLFKSTDNGAVWTRITNGLSDAIVNSLTHNQSGEIVAATQKGVFKIAPSELITNTGSWTDISHNLLDVPVFDLLTVSNDNTIAATQDGIYQFNGDNAWELWDTFPARLLFGTPGGEMIHVAGALDIMELTGDMGANFFSVDKGLQNRFVGALHTVKVFDWTVIFAGTDKGVELTSEFFSFEGELPWLLTREFSGAVFDLISHPIMADIIYAGAERTGVWKSTGFGSEWMQKSKGMVPTLINDIAQTAGENPILYTATSSGVYISRDNGTTWRTYSDTATPRHATTVALNTATDLVAYYGTEAGEIYSTFDGGESFFLRWPGNGKPIKDIAVAPFYNIYAITSDGQVLSSSDGGSNFFPLEAAAGFNATQIVIDPIMPWVAYLSTADNGIFKTTTRGLEWEEINTGVDIPYIFSIDIDSEDPDLLYAGTVDGLFKTTDGGTNWVYLNEGLPEGFVNRVKISPSDSKVIYANIDETSVYKSSDGGQNWEIHYESDENSIALPILPDRSNLDTIYLGDYQTGLKKTIDDGESWTNINDGLTLFVRTLATTPLEPDTLYAGSLSAGIFKSTDAAETWSPMGLQERNIFKVLVDPSDSNTVYAGTSLGLTRSTNGGLDWQDLGQKLDFVFQVQVDNTDPDIIYLTGLAGFISKSTDGGQSWRLLETDLPNANILAIAQDPVSGAIYVAPEREGIYKSEDGGETWTATNNSLYGDQVTTIVIDDNSNIYVGTQKKGIFVSTNQGQEWIQQDITDTDEEIYISSISVMSATTETNTHIFASILNDNENSLKVVATEAGSSEWKNVSNGIVEVGISSISSGANPSQLYAIASSPAVVYESLDNGESWEPIVTLDVSSNLSKILTDPKNQQQLYVFTNNDGLIVSSDGGNSWFEATSLESNNINQLILTDEGQLLAATLGQGLVISDDQGVSWSGGANTGIIYSSILGIAVNPSNSNQIFLATGGTGIHRSNDAGVGWDAVNNGLGDLKILSLLMDPIDPRILYAATAESGVFVTHDSGDNWTPLNNGLFNKTITSLSIDPNDNTIIYAGTEGGGVFRITQ